MATPASASEPRPVPVRTILVTIGLVLATLAAIKLVLLLAHLETLLVVSAFFATVLTPPVDWVSRRLHLKRGLAALVVFLLVIGGVGFAVYTFVRPLVDQTSQLVDDFPRYLADARAGRGPVGDLVRRYQLDQQYERYKPRLQDALTGAGGQAVAVAGRVFAGFVSVTTCLVITFMMVLYGPELLRSGLGALSPPRRERVRAVAADCAKAITGYVTGNLAISIVAGLVTFAALSAAGVPFRGVLALWVSFADLIPLIGATLGAVPTIIVAFLASVKAGVIMVVFFVVYQQLENHVLQPAVMSRTVSINQLFVLVSVLAGVELSGVLGALLAIPAAGVLQVIVRDLWDHRRGRPKDEPTLGEERIPVSEAPTPDEPAKDTAG